MDSLFAKADAIQPLRKRRKTEKDDHRPKKTKASGSGSSSHDATLTSVAQSTGLPKSLRSSSPPPEGTRAYSHIKDKKLRTQLTRESSQAVRAKKLVQDADLLLTEEKGLMEVEGDMEKTWRVGQDEVTDAAGQEAARGRKEWRLDGNPGYLKYQDTSTGQLVVEHRTKLGACTTMTQNQHNAVIHLGHQNGTVTLWTPNLPHPAVRLLAHLGPVASISVDASTGGRYMATSGQDGAVKVWDCRNWKGAVRTWNTRGGAAELEWSQRGALVVGTGGSVNVYVKPAIQTPFAGTVSPPLYMTHPIPHRPISSVRFCPFQDILTIGHSDGLSSILVPGAGEPNFDSSEADPFENKKARREREVKGLLDKIQPDMISVNPEFVGSLAPEPKLTTAVNDKHDIPFARLPRMERLRVSGKADETEETEDEGDDGEAGDGEGKPKLTKAEKEKKKMRGKNKSMKRYLRKQRKNVIDPKAVAVRHKLAKQRDEKERAKAEARGEGQPKSVALDRFKRRS
ncbi:Small subunit (SSU) processome component [Steccherinum ochraceum]|uniref:Small subunit (SSU) processome component n=1 Tax=Steccherinum ochraceum TaxID=92696 RepID=A0A4R0RVT0_9APHY|nr:Small subunit (SSU) processome component [Steccherinum ochraceum]